MSLAVKRLFDIAVSFAGLTVTLPLLLFFMLAVFFEDKHWPIFASHRIGRNGKSFYMYKVRSMVVDAHKSGVDTAAESDPRLTRLGPLIRRIKVDELPQFFNVLRGDMSLVGPRPQVPREVAIYTDVETHLLDALPGITDFSSIVFSDLAQIVNDQPSADIAYNQLVRPWKSRLGLFYIEKRTFGVDMLLIAMTVANLFARDFVLKKIAAKLDDLGAPAELVVVASRTQPLKPTPPPGMDYIVQDRRLSPSGRSVISAAGADILAGTGLAVPAAGPGPGGERH